MEGILEKWYWHTLYYSTQRDAQKMQACIIHSYDQYCSLEAVPCNEHTTLYTVTFCTHHPLSSELRVLLAIQIDAMPVSTFFNNLEKSPILDALLIVVSIVMSFLLSPAAISFYCYFLPVDFLAWLVDARMKQIDRELAELNGAELASLEDNLSQQLGLIQWDYQKEEC